MYVLKILFQLYPSGKILLEVSEKVCSIIEHCVEFINISKRLCMFIKTALILSKLEYGLL
jgi:hypothetical protein